MLPALELTDVSCVRGDRVLFDGLHAAVHSGQFLRVKGRNGSGKTSLLRMICGLSRPDEGEVRWHGRPIASDRESFNQELVYLGHSPALKDDLTALENLQAASGLAGTLDSAESHLRALECVGLALQARLPARLLSQGQRKRIGVARLVLRSTAPLWVLDEPFNALDAAACITLRDLVSAHCARGGVVVLTSHLGNDEQPASRQVTLDLDAHDPGFGDDSRGLVITDEPAAEAAWN